jgi:hypothetical protein
MLRLAVFEMPRESVTFTVKLKVPIVVGVPVIKPEGDKTNPVGRPPAVTVQVYGETPPDAASVAVGYVTLVVPDGRDVVATVSAALAVSVKFAVAVYPWVSFTWIVKEKDPPAVGVPVIAPVPGFNVNPGGKLPTVTLHVVYGGTPPEAASVTPP